MYARPATTQDVKAVEAVVQAAYAPWIEIIGATPGPLLDDYAALILAEHVSVVDGDLGIEAILVLIPQGDALLLDNVAVRPDAQGKSHGKRLIALAEARARRDGFGILRLYAHTKMSRNIALYESLEFIVTRRVTERGLSRIYMEKALL